MGNKKLNISNNKYFDVVIIFIFSVVLYINSIFNGYVLDDIVMISQNKFTKMGISGIKNILTHDTFMGYYGQNMLPGGRYRPLAQILFATEYSICGLNTVIGHLVNVLIYGFLCVLLLITLKKLLQPKEHREKSQGINLMPHISYLKSNFLTIPFIATLLFAAHPLHTEVVANIKSLDEILSLTGCFATLLLTIKYIDNRQSNPKSKQFYVLCLVSCVFLLALLAKENAITFLAIIPLTLFVFRKPKLRTYFTVSSVLFLAACVYFIIRYHAEGFLFNNNVQETELLNNPFLNASQQDKNATIFLTIGKYLQLLVFPHPLTYDYYPKQIPIISWIDIRALIPFLILTVLLVYSVMNMIYRFKDLSNHQITKSPNHQIIAYAILFFIITFSIQSNFLFNVGSFMNERFMFAPLLGFCLIVAYLISSKLKNQNVKIIVFLLILVAYTAKTISRNPVWKNEYTLFTTDVKISANSAKANVSAGRALLDKALIEKDTVLKKELLNESLIFSKHGLEIYPAYLYGWKVLGNTFFTIKDYENARISYNNALKVNSGYEEAFQNLLMTAQTVDNLKLFKESVICYRTLLIYKPGNPDYLYRLASGLSNIGKQDTALVILNNILYVKSEYFDAYNLIGSIYIEKYNDIEKALNYFHKAYSLKPDDNSILVNLGIAYGMKRDFKKSLEYFNKAILHNPNDPVNYRNIAVTYRNMGDISNYNKLLAKANQLQTK